jgi:hypothetical protein
LFRTIEALTFSPSSITDLILRFYGDDESRHTLISLLSNLLALNSTITSLDLSDNRWIGDNKLDDILLQELRKNVSLKSLNLFNCGSHDDSGISEYLQFNTTLGKLNISTSFFSTPRNLRNIPIALLNNTSLVSLNVYGQRFVKFSDFVELLKQKAFRDLDLSFCSGINVEDVLLFSKSLSLQYHTLQILSFAGINRSLFQSTEDTIVKLIESLV